MCTPGSPRIIARPLRPSWTNANRVSTVGSSPLLVGTYPDLRLPGGAVSAGTASGLAHAGAPVRRLRAGSGPAPGPAADDLFLPAVDQDIECVRAAAAGRVGKDTQLRPGNLVDARRLLVWRKCQQIEERDEFLAFGNREPYGDTGARADPLVGRDIYHPELLRRARGHRHAPGLGAERQDVGHGRPLPLSHFLFSYFCASVTRGAHGPGRPGTQGLLRRAAGAALPGTPGTARSCRPLTRPRPPICTEPSRTSLIRAHREPRRQQPRRRRRSAQRGRTPAGSGCP